MKQAMGLVRFAVMLCGSLLLIGFGIGSTVVAPDHALVFVDEDQLVYIAPPCVDHAKWMLYPQLTIEQAYKLEYGPEPKCRDEGGFTQEGRSLTGLLFQRIGLLAPQVSRWNPDGTWNW